MEKRLLSEISLYHGNIDMPKNFEIDRSKLKADILTSHLNEQRVSNNRFDYAFLDYELPFSRTLEMLTTYLREHFYLESKQSLIIHKSFGNILQPNEQTFSRYLTNPLDLKNSPDYIVIYGVDIFEGSSEVVIEYNDNRRAGKTWHIPLSNNHFVMFPSTQRFFITSNTSKQNNIILTSTFEYI